MAAATPPGLLSLEAWAARDEDARGELVDGVLVEEEVPDFIHELVVAFLLRRLADWLEPRGGVVVGSGLKLAVSPHRGRLGDVAAYFAGRRPPARGLVRIPPDVLVEVVSPSPGDERRDRVQKPRDYAAFGVKYYWLVDPALRSFEVWELDVTGRYAQALAAEGGRVEDVPGCEGLEIDLDALWGRVEAEEQRAP
ncbi:MAG TPA: Uma2 family endonuclease [Minicystis sp.]|nr:Uma2 family endonuclease [Minicystis sp.]